MWPELNDTPGGLTDSRAGMHETSQPTFKKDALLSSKLNNPSLPSSSHSLGQTEVSKVSETVQEVFTPPPQKAALKGNSKSDTLKKKKDIGESWKSKTVHLCPSVSSLISSRSHSSMWVVKVILWGCFYTYFTVLNDNVVFKVIWLCLVSWGDTPLASFC